MEQTRNYCVFVLCFSIVAQNIWLYLSLQYKNRCFCINYNYV